MRTPSALRVVRLALTTTVLASATVALGQSATSSWYEARANTSRTGTADLRFDITRPHLAWRVQRANPSVGTDGVGVRVFEMDIDGVPPLDLVGLTDRSMIAYSGATGATLWPMDDGEFYPLLSVVGIGDLNGDSLAEIVAIAKDNVVSVFDRQGRRRWALPSNRATPGYSGEVRLIQTRANGGTPALLVTRNDGGAPRTDIRVYTFNAMYDVTTVASVSFDDSNANAALHTAMGDFDGDGNIDLLSFKLTDVGLAVASLRRVDPQAAWPMAPTFTPLQTVGCPLGGTTDVYRIEVFRGPMGRDRVAFKRSITAGSSQTCVGVVGIEDMSSMPRVFWSVAIPGPDAGAGHFVADVVGEGVPTLELAVERDGVSIELLSIETGMQRGIVAPDAMIPRRIPLLLQGFVKIDSGPLMSILGSAVGSGDRQLVRFGPTGVERSPAFVGSFATSYVALAEGFNRYQFPQPQRREPIVMGESDSRAVLAHNTSFEMQSLDFDRARFLLPVVSTSTEVGHRLQANGGLVATISSRAALAGIRRIDRRGAIEGIQFFGTGPVVLPILGNPSTTNLGGAAHAELRGVRAGRGLEQFVLAPIRGAILDPRGFTPFESLNTWNAGSCSLVDDRQTTNMVAPDGTLLYASSGDLPTVTNTLRLDATTGMCSAPTTTDVQSVPPMRNWLSYSQDFFSVPVAGAQPPMQTVLGYANGVSVGSNREVRPTSLTTGLNLGAVNAAFTVNASTTIPMPVFAMVGRGANTAVSMLFQSSTVANVAPLRNVLVTFIENPLRSLSVPIGNSFASCSALAPIFVPASNGDALIVNNGSSTTTASQPRATLWRFSPSPIPQFTLAAVGPPESVVDSTSGVVVRCGAAGSGRYRFIFKHRTSLTTEDARFESLEFTNAPSEVALPVSAAAWSTQQAENFSSNWRVCLDRPANDCSVPNPAIKYSRILYGNLAAVQNGTNPVVLISGSDGSLTALSRVCGTVADPNAPPIVSWKLANGRALGSLSVIDSDGDGAAEVVGLSSDGTYNVFTDEECNRVNDPRCPIDRPICDVESRACVQCSTDVHCQQSVGGSCNVERHICDPCVGSNTACATTGGQCTRRPRGNLSANACECDAANPCRRGYSCVGANAGQRTRGQCTALCTATNGVCPPGFSCEIAGMEAYGRCVASCATNADCERQSPSRPICAVASVRGDPRQCVQCEESAQCASATPEMPVCDRQRCVQCTSASSALCGSSPNGSVCLPTGVCGCALDSDCPMDRRCGVNSGRCIVPPTAMRFVDPTCGCAIIGRHRPLNRGLPWMAIAALWVARRSRRGSKNTGIWLSRGVPRAQRSTLVAVLLFAGLATQASVASTQAARAIRCGEEANPDLFNDARDRFEAGQTALLAGDGVGAERVLREALAIFESPNTVLLLARALRAQNRTDEAYEALEETIALATRCSIRDNTERGRARYARSLEAAAVERSQIANLVALLGLRFAAGIPAETSITIDNRAPTAVTADRVYPASAQGVRHIRVVAPRHRPWDGDVQLVLGRVISTEVHLEPIVEGPRIVERLVGTNLVQVQRRSVLFPVGLGIWSAGVVTGVIGVGLFVSGINRYDALNASCTATMCPAEGSFLAAVDRAERTESVGRILMITGGSVGAVGLTLLLVGLPRTEWVAAPRPAAIVLPSIGGAQIVGVF